MYHILPYSYKKAKKLGVNIVPSLRKNKKIDVLDGNNQYICSIGDSRYKDYPTYLLQKGKYYADNRRRLYRIRHHKELENITMDEWEGTPSYYSWIILW